jgi:hypothetical protein
MGHHYVPQEYLRGFADPHSPGAIWMYDKLSRRFLHASIKSIVQEAGYYSKEAEKQLSELVEGPAHYALKKLRRGDSIGDTERTQMALYLGTMLMRVPRRRKKAFDMLPGVLEDTINKVSAQVVQWAHSEGADFQLVSRRFAELERARESLRREPPLEVVEQIRAPWASERILALVSAMTWRIVSTGGVAFFITSDNPAYFFEAYGLGNPESELTFPLASDMALLASWQGAPRETIFLNAKPALVKEVNRRVASGAERFVFYHAREEWVAKIADKQRPYLSRIQW